MSDETKNDKTIAKAYTDAINGAEKFEQLFTTLKRELRDQAEEVAAGAEARRRAFDAEAYDMAQVRQKVLDEQAREDQDRDNAFTQRQKSLREAELELASLVGVTPADFTPKAVRVAYESAIAKAEKSGEGKGLLHRPQW